MTWNADATLRRFPLHGRDASSAPASGSWIYDLSARPRLGLRGSGIADWCTANRLPFPEQINAVSDAGQLVVVRLGMTEILVLPEGDMPRLLPFHTSVVDTYREESWFWFRMEGADAREALSRLTSADLRPNVAPAGTAVQTRLAGLDAVLLIHDDSRVDIFSDSASADYMIDVFRDRCPEWPVWL